MASSAHPGTRIASPVPRSPPKGLWSVLAQRGPCSAFASPTHSGGRRPRPHADCVRPGGDGIQLVVSNHPRIPPRPNIPSATFCGARCVIASLAPLDPFRRSPCSIRYRRAGGDPWVWRGRASEVLVSLAHDLLHRASERTIPIADAGTLAQRSRHHCNTGHRVHLNQTFRDGHHSRGSRSGGDGRSL